MGRFSFLMLGCALAVFVKPAEAAPTCDSVYTVGPGDTLTNIARSAYGDIKLWPYIYGYGKNARNIGGNPGRISIGTTLDLPPCLRTAQPVGKAATGDDQAVSLDTPLEVVTATDYAPWTDQNWEEGGMLTEIVQAVLSQSGTDRDHAIEWVNDRSAHIEPLLARQKYDMGFPWFRPTCAASEADTQRCGFHFSKPLYDMRIVLYQRKDDARVLAEDQDLHGMRLCRPAGLFTTDLAERGLIPGDTIELNQPRTVGDCFHKLVDGDVDFVTLNEFTGQSAIREFGYGDLVTASEKLTDIQGLHLIVHKDHPDADALMQAFDDGLRALHASGRYDEIVGRHLAIFHGQTS